MRSRASSDELPVDLGYAMPAECQGLVQIEHASN